MSSTADISTDDYASRTGQSEIPVQSDTAKVESTEYDNGGDSDKQLGTPYSNHTLKVWYWSSVEKDEKDAIDSSNIIDERTRGATKKAGTYTEPSDEEGLDEVTQGGQDGTSSGRQ
jgi:hypothetical protein